jgi:hypothetical protein
MHRIAALFIVGTCWVIYSLLLAGAEFCGGSLAVHRHRRATPTP